MNTLFHFLKEFIYNMNHHRLLTIGAIFTSAFIWIVLGFFVMIYFNLFLLYSNLKGDVKLAVYLQDNLNPNEIKSLEERLSEDREIQSVHFVSKEKALEDFRKTLKERDDLFQNFEGNPLPNYFEVKFKDQYQTSGDFAAFSSKIKGNKGVEDVFYAKEWVDSLNRTIQFIKIMGVAVGFILVIGVITMVGIIVRLTVYSKREEIQILKYIGATEWFIKIPLLIEGGFLGLMSAALSLMFLYALFDFLSAIEPIHNLLMGSPFTATFLPWNFILIFLISGPFLGIVGSLFPLQKYLKSFN